MRRSCAKVVNARLSALYTRSRSRVVNNQVFTHVSKGGCLKRVRLGYMRVKEFKGLMRVEITPISREKALAMLRGERLAS